MRYNHTHTLDTDLDAFWELFFDSEFNRALYLGQLKYTTYNVLENELDDDGTRRLRVECVPKIDVPPAARAFFGNSAGYTEVGHFDPATRRYSMKVFPAFGGDKVKMESEIWAEPVESKRIIRHVTGEVVVKIFGLSKLIENVTQQQTRDSYAQSAEFINRWVRDRGL